MAKASQHSWQHSCKLKVKALENTTFQKVCFFVDLTQKLTSETTTPSSAIKLG